MAASQPETAPPPGSPSTRAPGPPAASVLVLSGQAQRFLKLESRSFATEFIGCMIGEVWGSVVFVNRIAPADVEPNESATTHVVPRETCEGSGWKGTVGVIHSHPTADRCWYFFPGTEVMSSDGQSFLYQPYPVDAILCGHQVVWISRDLSQHEVPLVPADKQATTKPRPQRGNLVQAGAGLSPGED